MNDIGRLKSDARLSRVVTYNGIAYLSGLTADNRAGSMAEQTKEVLGKIDTLLLQAGTNKSRLLSAMIYISEMSQKSSMDEVWVAWVDPKNAPTRAVVRADLGTRETLIEILVTAAL